jgi:hypothetical protein
MSIPEVVARVLSLVRARLSAAEAD